MKYNYDVENILEISSNLSINKFFQYFIMLILFSLLISFIKMEKYGYVTLVIYVILGVSIFIKALNNKFTQFSEFIIRDHPILSHICLITFIISLTVSIIYLRFFESLYTKSLYYYLFIGICTSAMFITSISVKNEAIKKLLPYVTFLFGFNILLSNWLVFPNGVYASGDTHAQIYNIVLPIVKNGHIPPGFTYYFFPIFQILIASLAKITIIEPVFLYMSMTSLLYSVSALFVYSLLSHIADSRFGITAMLLFMMAPSTFYHGIHAYQFSYALPLGIMLMCVTTILTIQDDCEKNKNLLQKRVSWVIVRILLIVTIIWTHQFTSTLIFVFIVIFEITYYFGLKNNANRLSFNYVVILLYIVILLAHWIYASYLISSLVNVFNIYYNSLFTYENYQAAAVSKISYSIPFWLIFFDTSGRGILMMLGSIGSLYGIWKKNIYIFVWVAIGAFIWALISVGGFIQMPLLLSGRLFAFFEAISLVYLATFGVILLIERFGTKSLIFCSVLLFILPIFSLGSTTSGSETSLFVGNQPFVKYYDTYSDLQYRTWIKNTVQMNSSIRVSEPWAPQYLDNSRVYYQLPINDHDQVVENELMSGEYIVLNKHDSMGVRVRGISEVEQIKQVNDNNISTVESQNMHLRMIKLDISENKRVTSQLKHIYSNGETDICLK